MERTAVLRAGLGAAAELLHPDHSALAKAVLNPAVDEDFLEMVQELRTALVGLVGAAEAQALQAALDALRVDWARLTPAARDRAVLAAQAALATPAVDWPRLQDRLEVEGRVVMGGMRRHVKRTFGLDVAVDLSAVDKRVAAHAAASQAVYVRDHYGQRAAVAGARARQIIAEGVDRGLGRQELARQLAQAVELAQLGRTPAYFQVVAASAVSRARSYASLSSYAEGGVTEYEFLSVLDEVTSLPCRFLHGRRFSVAKGLRRFTDAAASDDPSALVTASPWLSTGRDASGTPQLYVKDASGERQVVATVTANAVGQRDQAGAFATTYTNQRLSDLGVSTPPLHGNCRSTLVPVTDI